MKGSRIEQLHTPPAVHCAFVWLPDETLFSFCSRYHERSGSALGSDTCRSLFGHSTQGSQHDFPSRLLDFCIHTEGKLGQPDDIIREHSIAPFHLIFESEASVAACSACMSQDQIGAMKYRLGLIASGFRSNFPLKFCPECVRSDTDEFGTPYWHRAHQLIPTLTCTRHGSHLVEFDRKANGIGRFLWHLPPVGGERRKKSFRHAAGVSKLGVAHRISAMAEEMLSYAECGAMSPTKAIQVIERKLSAKDFITESGRLRHMKLTDAWAEFTSSIREFSSLATIEKPNTVARVIDRTNGRPNPVRFLCVVAWLYPKFTEFVADYDSACLALPCRGERSIPDERSRDKREPTFVTLLESGSTISAASRTVGIDTQTGQMWAARYGHVPKRRPKKISTQTRMTIIDGLARGLNKPVLAAAHGLSVVSVTRILLTSPGLPERRRKTLFQDRLNEARSMWIAAMTHQPSAGVNAWRREEPAAFALLYRNDRNWLKATYEGIPPKLKNPIEVRINWNQRDAYLAQSVRQVAQTVLREHGSPATLQDLVRSIPTLRPQLGNLARLPQTAAILRSHGKRRRKRSAN